jgi:hypothetical protein
MRFFFLFSRLGVNKGFRKSYCELLISAPCQILAAYIAEGAQDPRGSVLNHVDSSVEPPVLSTGKEDKQTRVLDCGKLNHKHR